MASSRLAIPALMPLDLAPAITSRRRRRDLERHVQLGLATGIGVAIGLALPLVLTGQAARIAALFLFLAALATAALAGGAIAGAVNEWLHGHRQERAFNRLLKTAPDLAARAACRHRSA